TIRTHTTSTIEDLLIDSVILSDVDNVGIGFTTSDAESLIKRVRLSNIESHSGGSSVISASPSIIDLSIDGIDIYDNTNVAIYLNDVGGRMSVRNVNVDGTTGANSYGLRVTEHVQGGAVFENIEVRGCSAHGIYIASSPECALRNITSVENDLAGVIVESCQRAQMSGIQAYNNSLDPANTWAGVQVSGTAANISGHNINSYDTQGGGATQRYGLNIGASVSDSEFIGTKTHGNTIQGVLDGGTGNTIFDVTGAANISGKLIAS
ncbi:unnamed protein product, partial [marine sediment metagenome]